MEYYYGNLQNKTSNSMHFCTLGYRCTTPPHSVQLLICTALLKPTVMFSLAYRGNLRLNYPAIHHSPSINVMEFVCTSLAVQRVKQYFKYLKKILKTQKLRIYINYRISFTNTYAFKVIIEVSFLLIMSKLRGILTAIYLVLQLSLRRLFR